MSTVLSYRHALYSHSRSLVVVGTAWTLFNTRPFVAAAPFAPEPQPRAAGQNLYVDTTDPGVSGEVYAGSTYTVPAGGDTFANVADGYNKTGLITQTSGALAISNGLTLGQSQGSTGTYTMNGGTLTAASVSVGASGAGTFNQNNGTCTFGGTLGIGVFSDSSGTYNLNGGVLQVGGLAQYFGSGAVNFNGGILQATADNTDYLARLSTNVLVNGARLDTNGHTLTITNALAHAAGATADGGLTKSGAGTLTLTGSSTFNGPTLINGGTLALKAATSGSAALGSTSAVSVNTGGTLLLNTANQINPSAPMTLNANSGPASGATAAFNTGGNSQTLGALTLSSTSVIDLASGASLLRFANSSANTWTGTLAVWNWTGNVLTGRGTDELFFGSSASGLTAAQLAQIQFFSDAGVTNVGTGVFAATNPGEVVANGVSVPEPSTWLAGALSLCLAGSAVGRRFR